MPRPHTLQRIDKPDEYTCFCFSVRRPFTASIWRKRKESQKYPKGVTHKRKCTCGQSLKRNWNLCPICGAKSGEVTFRMRMVWGDWKQLKAKVVRSRRQAIKVAQRWFDQASNRKLRAVKV